MKYTIYIFIIFFFSNCSKDKIQNNDQIKLSNYSVYLLAGNECIIDVLCNSEKLSLIEENPEIVSGWWTNNGKSIRIKGENVGCASIYVKDKTMPERKTEIKVTSDYFSGNYKENRTKATIMVQAYNQSVKEKIETDLMSIIQNRTETLYSFNKDTNSVIITTNGHKSIGTYSWNINSLTITNDKSTENYIFRFNDDSSIEIEQDLKDKFQQIYPEQTLYCVRLVFHLSKY